MNDLKRMESFYSNKDKNEWSLFNCYPLFLDFKQTTVMTKILNNIKLDSSKFLDIGAGEGNFILKMFMLGIQSDNTTAVEYLEERYEKLVKKIPNICTINDDFLNTKLTQNYDIITLMAVLTSITDNDTRYKIVEKSLKLLSEDAKLIIYDYFDENETYLSDNYRALSLNKIRGIAKDYKIEIYRKVYLKSIYAKGLCKIKLQMLIPFFESLKIFNDNYHFVVISNEK
jgi:phospholipid N-methyltransferase